MINNSEFPPYLNPNFLAEILKTEMPFGKYNGIKLINLPESYIVWFSQKGFPEGKLGDMMRVVYEIKANGLEYLFDAKHKH